jgi:hypothetical protein
MSTASAGWSLSDEVRGPITNARLGYGGELLLDFGATGDDQNWLVSSQSSPWYREPLHGGDDAEDIAARLKDDAVSSLHVSSDSRSLELRLASGGRVIIAGDRAPNTTIGPLWQVFDPHGAVWTAYRDGSVTRTHADTPLALSDREQLELEVRVLERGFGRLTHWTMIVTGVTALTSLVLLGLVISGAPVSNEVLTATTALFPTLLFLTLTRISGDLSR